jgi:2-keto-4-pentenoate hydratase/2-oxohepta-3-ene-1,7-dioic acid hydratase in catechol pathway
VVSRPARYCRFFHEGASSYGALADDRIEAWSAAPWAGGASTGKLFSVNEIRLLAPVEPGKIIGLARTYRDHAAELGNPVPREPLMFLKPPSAVIGPEEAIVLPPGLGRIDYEGELGLVIGRRCAGLRAEENALDYVFGCTCVNDVTARDLQKSDGHFTRAKGFDTFCALGPAVVTGLDPKALRVETYVNGERRQRGAVGEMIFSLDAIIRFIAAVMTLEPGDVISTGTPPGVGPLEAGDKVEVIIEDIGRLRNPVKAGAAGRGEA